MSDNFEKVGMRTNVIYAQNGSLNCVIVNL